jgi:succinate-semialdehyde dehydrogenase/glutarate-semialdehyde dehydrogenase
MGIATINPATGETIKTFEPLDGESIEIKLALSQQTFEKYRKTPIAQRAQWLIAAAEILERDKVSFGKIMTTEMGKTIQKCDRRSRKVRLSLPLLRRTRG